MHVSLSELEATLCKAASGVGLPLGLGQDAGRAARLMAGQGHDSLPAFVAALEAVDKGLSGGFSAEPALGGRFTTDQPAEHLSALRAGPSACDLLLSAASGHGTPREIALESVDAPGVVLAEASAATRDLDGAVSLSWRSGAEAPLEATCQGGVIRSEEDIAALLSSPGPATMILRLTEAAAPREAAPSDACREGAKADGETWRRLAAFAGRTLVEATEASRLTGAGAGLVDAD